MEIKTQPKSEKRSQFVPSGSGHFWGVNRQILLLPPPQPSPPQIHSIQTEPLSQPGTVCVPMLTPFLVVTWQLDPSITRWSNWYDVATWSIHLPEACPQPPTSSGSHVIVIHPSHPTNSSESYVQVSDLVPVNKTLLGWPRPALRRCWWLFLNLMARMLLIQNSQGMRHSNTLGDLLTYRLPVLKEK